FDEWLKKGNEGDVITMKDLYYKLSSTTQRSVSNGGTTSSDIIRINVSDVNELSLIEVYCDGELIKSQDTTSGFSHIIVSRWGSYKVVA
ncbi:MAG: hypothetical protein J6U68_03170, partial [Clostridia bacterium]|nr:hypothetical protein [Clostridia bacterium]